MLSAFSSMRLLLACAVSAAVVLASPFMGRLQSLLRSSVSTRVYVLLLGGVVIGSIAAAVVTAFIRIKGNRGKRVAAMAAAIGLGLAYTAIMSTGDATIDAVERVHFIEYGLIAVLFYRVWRRPSTTLGAALSNVEGRAGDLSTLVLPILCGLIVGTLDEWLQWFIPYRVGEMHDVLLNFTSLVCGVLFGLALEPPPAFSWRLAPDGWSRLGVATAAAVLVFGAFVGVIHLGTCGRSMVSAHSSRGTRLPSSRLYNESATPGGSPVRHSILRACLVKISISMKGYGTCASAIACGTSSGSRRRGTKT